MQLTVQQLRYAIPVLAGVAVFVVFLTFRRNLNFFGKQDALGITPKPLSPLIIVPGCGGSQIFGKLEKAGSDVPLCDLHQIHGFYRLWPSPEVALPVAIDCWVDNFRLFYDELTGSTRSRDGVIVHVPGFGETDFIEYLSDIKVEPAKYFYHLVTSAVGWGYTRAINVRGAPYDFRKSPAESAEYFANLKTLIEETSAANADLPVHLLAHSLGNLFTLYFLHNQTQAWKDRYVKTYFALGAPFAGSMQAVKALASGYNLGASILPHLKLRNAQRTWPSITLMLPRLPAFGEDHVLVDSHHRNYTIAHYADFFRDIGHEAGHLLYEKMKALVDPLLGPGVETHCIVGTKLNSSVGVRYALGHFPDTQPVDIFDDGDGTVATRSASVCKHWISAQKQPVHYREFEKVEHLELVYNPNVVDYIKSVLVASPDSQSQPKEEL